MSDNKIIDMNSFKKKAKKPDNQVLIINNDNTVFMETLIQQLHDTGYNITDPNILHDLEVISLLIAAMLCRQMNVENKNIPILDELKRVEDIDE